MCNQDPEQISYLKHFSTEESRQGSFVEKMSLSYEKLDNMMCLSSNLWVALNSKEMCLMFLSWMLYNVRRGETYTQNCGRKDIRPYWNGLITIECVGSTPRISSYRNLFTSLSNNSPVFIGLKFYKCAKLDFVNTLNGTFYFLNCLFQPDECHLFSSCILITSW